MQWLLNLSKSLLEAFETNLESKLQETLNNFKKKKSCFESFKSSQQDEISAFGSKHQELYEDAGRGYQRMINCWMEFPRWEEGDPIGRILEQRIFLLS